MTNFIWPGSHSLWVTARFCIWMNGLEKYGLRKKRTSYEVLSIMETVGIEPMTFCMSSRHSNQLSYASATVTLYHTARDNAIPFQNFFQKDL